MHKSGIIQSITRKTAILSNFPRQVTLIFSVTSNVAHSKTDTGVEFEDQGTRDACLYKAIITMLRKSMRCFCQRCFVRSGMHPSLIVAYAPKIESSASRFEAKDLRQKRERIIFPSLTFLGKIKKLMKTRFISPPSIPASND